MIPESMTDVPAGTKYYDLHHLKKMMVQRGQELATEVWMQRQEEFPVPLVLAAEIRMLKVPPVEGSLHTVAMGAFKTRLLRLRRG